MKLRFSLSPSFILVVFLANTWVYGATGYGVDCSFPIHNSTLKDCGLGDRQSVYEQYMKGCRERYGAQDCDETEQFRIDMNIRQPMSVMNFTSGGFRKIRAPETLQKLLNEFWEKNKDSESIENWDKGDIYTNHWEAPTYMVNIEDTGLEGGGEALQKAIWAAAQGGIEDWVDIEGSNMRLRPSSVYGIRVYKEGAMLNPHVDRIPLISSAIYNVAQDVDEDWPLEVYDRFGDAVNVTMQPGDMVFYESHSLIHGRPFPLKGRYFANIFIHFEPTDDVDFDGPNEKLPPYILPNSPEAEWWILNDFFRDAEEEQDETINNVVALGDLELVRVAVEEDPLAVHYTDENGWQPLHEAARTGQLEIVRYLLEMGADMNARVEIGPTPLNIAKHVLGVDHPITMLFIDQGAEDHGVEGYPEDEYWAGVWDNYDDEEEGELGEDKEWDDEEEGAYDDEESTEWEEDSEKSLDPSCDSKDAIGGVHQEMLV